MSVKRLTEQETLDAIEDCVRAMDEQDVPTTNRHVKFGDGIEYRSDEQGNWTLVEAPVSLGTPEDPVVVTPGNVAQVGDAVDRLLLFYPEPAQPME